MLQVACQRLILLVAACFAAGTRIARCNSWPEEYTQLLLGVNGENICTKAGREKAKAMMGELLLRHAERPVQISTAHGQVGIDLAIINSTAVNKVSTAHMLLQLLCSCSRPTQKIPCFSSTLRCEA